MELEEKWRKTIEETKIFRFYRYPLSVQEATTVPYIFLGQSIINIGDTVVRKGKVVIDRPYIVLPKNMPQFSGFEFEQDLDTNEDALRMFFMVRGINFPSLKYKHEISTIDVFEKNAEKTVEYFLDDLERKEDLSTGLVFGPVEYWQFSILFYVISLISRSASRDIDKYLDDLRRRFLS